MKRIVALLTLLAVSVAALAQSGKDIYNKYSDLPGVEAVYISQSMFRLIGRIPDIEVNDKDVNLTSFIKTLSGFYMISCKKNQTAAKEIYDDVKNYIGSGKYELLMESKDNGDIVRIYSLGDEKTIESFVMLEQDDSETSFICFEGKMNRGELENILAGTLSH